MGIISLERIDNLIWLDRYSERIYLTIKEFFSIMIKCLTIQIYIKNTVTHYRFQ